MMQTGPSSVLGAAGASGEAPRQSLGLRRGGDSCGAGGCQGECDGQEASTGGKTEAVR